VLVVARREAGPCEWRSELKGYIIQRLSITTLGRQEPNGKKVKQQPKQESTYSFLWGLIKRELLSMKMMMMGENQKASHRSLQQ
jgi:hypothetical protein